MTHLDSIRAAARLIARARDAYDEEGVHRAASSPRNSRKPPTEAQAKAGNTALGVASWQGISLRIENPCGTKREGADPDGTPWCNTMAAHYGYIAGTRGADGDAIDVFLGPNASGGQAWIINQTDAAGSFDEHKVMVGFLDAGHAAAAYRTSYTPGWQRFHPPIPVSLSQLKWWLANGDHTLAFHPDHVPPETPTMTPMQPTLDGVTRRVFWDSAAMPTYGVTLDEVLYRIRSHDGDEGLLMDPLTMAEVMEGEQAVRLDAMVVEVGRLRFQMDAMVRIMNSVGGDLKVLAHQISDPVRRFGGAHVAVIFELSDGQTITCWLHNPDATPAKLTPADELIAWKWVLNKKDFTIWVSPENGKELEAREVARRAMRLAAKNSAAFARANAKRADTMKAIEGLRQTVALQQAELADLDRQIAERRALKEAEASVVPEWQAIGSGDLTAADYAKILAGGEQAMLYWQDRLDPLFAQRIVDVRSELRGLGWEGEQWAWPLAKGGAAIDIALTQVGAGRNVAGVKWIISGNLRPENGGKAWLVDDLKTPPDVMAAWLNDQVAEADAPAPAAEPVEPPAPAKPAADTSPFTGANDEAKSLLALGGPAYDAALKVQRWADSNGVSIGWEATTSVPQAAEVFDAVALDETAAAGLATKPTGPVNVFAEGDKVTQKDTGKDFTVTVQKGHRVFVRGQAEWIHANSLRRTDGKVAPRIYLDAAEALAVPLLDSAELAVVLAGAAKAILDAGDAGRAASAVKGLPRLDSADPRHAIVQLEVALDVVTTNEPINRAEGKLDQADLELAAAASYRDAIAVLTARMDAAAAPAEEGEAAKSNEDDKAAAKPTEGDKPAEGGEAKAKEGDKPAAAPAEGEGEAPPAKAEKPAEGEEAKDAPPADGAAEGEKKPAADAPAEGEKKKEAKLDAALKGPAEEIVVRDGSRVTMRLSIDDFRAILVKSGAPSSARTAAPSALVKLYNERNASAGEKQVASVEASDAFKKAAKMDDATGGLFGTGDSGYLKGSMTAEGQAFGAVFVRGDGMALFEPREGRSQTEGEVENIGTWRPDITADDLDAALEAFFKVTSGAGGWLPKGFSRGEFEAAMASRGWTASKGSPTYQWTRTTEGMKYEATLRPGDSREERDEATVSVAVEEPRHNSTVTLDLDEMTLGAAKPETVADFTVLTMKSDAAQRAAEAADDADLREKCEAFGKGKPGFMGVAGPTPGVTMDSLAKTLLNRKPVGSWCFVIRPVTGLMVWARLELNGKKAMLMAASAVKDTPEDAYADAIERTRKAGVRIMADGQIAPKVVEEPTKVAEVPFWKQDDFDPIAKYLSIVSNDEALAFWQAKLDPVLTQRYFAITKALRDMGWSGETESMTKGGATLKVTTFQPSGGNIAKVSYKVVGKSTTEDETVDALFDISPEEFARDLDLRAKATPKEPAADAPETEAATAAADPGAALAALAQFGWAQPEGTWGPEWMARMFPGGRKGTANPEGLRRVMARLEMAGEGDERDAWLVGTHGVSASGGSAVVANVKVGADPVASAREFNEQAEKWAAPAAAPAPEPAVTPPAPQPGAFELWHQMVLSELEATGMTRAEAVELFDPRESDMRSAFAASTTAKEAADGLYAAWQSQRAADEPPAPPAEDGNVAFLREVNAGTHDAMDVTALLDRIEAAAKALEAAGALAAGSEAERLANDAINRWVDLEQKANG